MLFLLDTNIISFFMEGNQTVANNFVQCLHAGNSIKIPSIAYYEIQRGLLYKNAKRLQNNQQHQAFGEIAGHSASRLDTSMVITSHVRQAFSGVKFYD